MHPYAASIQQQIAEFFQHNMGSVSESATLWTAYKAFSRGVLIQMGTQAKKRRSQQFNQITNYIKFLDS